MVGRGEFLELELECFQGMGILWGLDWAGQLERHFYSEVSTALHSLPLPWRPEWIF